MAARLGESKLWIQPVQVSFKADLVSDTACSADTAWLDCLSKLFHGNLKENPVMTQVNDNPKCQYLQLLIDEVATKYFCP